MPDMSAKYVFECSNLSTRTSDITQDDYVSNNPMGFMTINVLVLGDRRTL